MVDRQQIELAKSLSGKRVRFNHETGGWHEVVDVSRDGMIELHDLGGWFAPHLFTVVEELAKAAAAPDVSEGKRKSLAFVAEIDQAELGVRLMERAIGMKRAGDTRAPGAILSEAEADWPATECGRFPFGDMATIAIEYFRECVEKGQRPS